MSPLTVTADSAVAHRTARAVLHLVDSAGAPLSGATVTVAQVRHEFGTGCTGFDQVPLANGEAWMDGCIEGGADDGLEAVAERWLEVFDTATLPFYWRFFEPERGHPDTARLRATAQYFHDNNVTVKGHPLAWHTLAPAWLEELSVDEVKDAVLARVRRDVADFTGLVDLWDAVNEAVIMPIFTQEANGLTRWAARDGRVAVIKAVVEAARETDPGARFVLNDFNMSTKYSTLIQECLDAGIQLDAIGLQSHMHQGWWGVERTHEVLDRFSGFGLPLQLTETSLVSGHLMPAEIVDLNDYQVSSWPSTPEGEARQAEELIAHVRLLIADPAVESFTLWGLSDASTWLGAPVGLIRADGSLKPSFTALRSLLREQWWLAPTTTQTDGSGAVTLDAFRGSYRVTLADGRTAELTLDAAAATEGITLTF